MIVKCYLQRSHIFGSFAVRSSLQLPYMYYRQYMYISEIKPAKAKFKIHFPTEVAEQGD